MKKLFLIFTLALGTCNPAYTQMSESQRLAFLQTDIMLWKNIVGKDVAYVQPTTLPRPINEFFYFKQLAGK